ncbi:MAG TPA: hypothetical protein VKD72_15370, partial [Gemmataceae bacterium]|nr:hypothetical protein [Gemmataceae bacterium]
MSDRGAAPENDQGRPRTTRLLFADGPAMFSHRLAGLQTRATAETDLTTEAAIAELTAELAA